MKLFAINTEDGLKPMYPSDLDAKKKLRIGEVYSVEVKYDRNWKFHKKFFALVNLGWQNSKYDMPYDTYRKYVIMKAGYVLTYQTDKGVLYEAESISYGSCGQEKFERVFNDVLGVIANEIGVESKEIMEQILNFM